MAVRLNAGTARLARTADLPAATSFTICGWARQGSTTGYQSIAGMWNTTPNPTGGALELAVDAGTLEITWYGTGAGNGTLQVVTTPGGFSANLVQYVNHGTAAAVQRLEVMYGASRGQIAAGALLTDA